ncbi:hypothetical protein FACS1894217_08190 [Clostridia bacterium]|nr:hypothetical protein FACS1894217_08190 [Clostridia bacterium]
MSDTGLSRINIQMPTEIFEQIEVAAEQSGYQVRHKYQGNRVRQRPSAAVAGAFLRMAFR